MKIAIFGVGGVGGYLAAQATNYFKNDNNIQFYYIARGEHLQAIRQNGLKLLRDGVEQCVSYPFLATDDIKECGKLDYIIYTTKSYSIDDNLEDLKAVCDENTTIVTFMNGVDGAQKLSEALPGVKISQGCVYVYSKILSAGVISETGALAHFYVGDKAFVDLMSPAVDKISFHEDVEMRIWEKFSYISPFATLTTWYNITSDQITNSEEYRAIFKALCDEFEAVALALGIKFKWSVYERNAALRDKSPVGSTSSMQRDYHSGRSSEVESLTCYISQMGRKLGVPTPSYDKAGEALVSKDKAND